MISTLEPIVRADDLFGSLQSENEGEDRDFQIERNTALEGIVNGFCHALKKEIQYKSIDHVYQTVSESSITAPAKDIEKFSSLLAGYLYEPDFDIVAGFYLSALINKSPDKEFNLNIERVGKGIRFFGYKNYGKRIILNGDIEDIGYQKSGYIELRGDCWNINELDGGYVLVRGNVMNIDHVNGGTVEVLGDVHSAGNSSSGGKIIVHGNVSGNAGRLMKGGEIHIGGCSQHLGGGMSKGKIYLYGGGYNAWDIENKSWRGKIIKKQGKFRRKLKWLY